MLWCYGSRGIASHNMLWEGRPGSTVLWPERPRAGLLAAGISASRAAAREVGSASIAKYFLFCPQVKFNNINLPPEAERWLQIAQSRPPLPSPSRNLLPVSNSYSMQLCTLHPFLTCMSFPQFNSRPFSFLFPLHVSRFLKSGRCYEVLAES